MFARRYGLRPVPNLAAPFLHEVAAKTAAVRRFSAVSCPGSVLNTSQVATVATRPGGDIRTEVTPNSEACAAHFGDAPSPPPPPRVSARGRVNWSLCNVHEMVYV